MPRPDSLNPAKARLAAERADRPGEDCRAEPGTYTIVVDRGKCEGKGDCVEVCPYGVFQVGRISHADYESLGIFGKLKSIAHGRKTAHTPKLADCHACGLCIVACPEQALTLRRA